MIVRGIVVVYLVFFFVFFFWFSFRFHSYDTFCIGLSTRSRLTALWGRVDFMGATKSFTAQGTSVRTQAL